MENGIEEVFIGFEWSFVVFEPQFGIGCFGYLDNQPIWNWIWMVVKEVSVIFFSLCGGLVQ